MVAVAERDARKPAVDEEGARLAVPLWTEMRSVWRKGARVAAAR